MGEIHRGMVEDMPPASVIAGPVGGLLGWWCFSQKRKNHFSGMECAGVLRKGWEPWTERKN